MSAWTVSGELVVMVILGGLGTVFGGAIGALALLTIEELRTSVRNTVLAYRLEQSGVPPNWQGEIWRSKSADRHVVVCAKMHSSGLCGSSPLTTS